VPLPSDFQNILQEFVYTNLPSLINPNTIQSAVFTAAVQSTPPTTPLTPVTPLIPSAAFNAVPAAAAAAAPAPSAVVPAGGAAPAVPPAPVIVIPPQVVPALQAASLSNFRELGLPGDFQEIAQIFFSILPPLPRTAVIPAPSAAPPAPAAPLNPANPATLATG